MIDECLNKADFFANPYPVYTQLRIEDPIHWSNHLNGWVLTRYTDIKSVLLDPTHFSNVGEVTQLLAQLPGADEGHFDALKQHYEQGGLVHSDPPDHTRLRNLISKAFTPRVVKRLKPFIQATVNHLLDKIQSSGQMEVIADLAFPLPAIVIAEMLGVPSNDRKQFRIWAENIMAFAGSGQVQAQLAIQAQQSLLEILAYFRYLLDQNSPDAGESLLIRLAHAEEQGDKLNEQELLGTCVTLLVAGFETTTNLIGNGLLALLKHPEQLRHLKENPHLIEAAIEEFLRYDSMLQGIRRIVKTNIEFGDKKMVQGQIVYAMLGAANRDPAQFSNPDQLDITRPHKTNKHLAFGYGIHYCLGAPLARVEAAVAINTILQRFPNIQLANDKFHWRENILLHGLNSLPVAF